VLIVIAAAVALMWWQLVLQPCYMKVCDRQSVNKAVVRC